MLYLWETKAPKAGSLSGQPIPGFIVLRVHLHLFCWATATRAGQAGDMIAESVYSPEHQILAFVLYTTWDVDAAPESRYIFCVCVFVRQFMSFSSDIFSPQSNNVFQSVSDSDRSCVHLLSGKYASQYGFYTLRQKYNQVHVLNIPTVILSLYSYSIFVQSIKTK